VTYNFEGFTVVSGKPERHSVQKERNERQVLFSPFTSVSEGSNVMRLVTSVIAVAVVATAPAQAAWKQYKFPDLGIYKDFPVEPARTVTTYKPAIRLPFGKEAPAVVLTAVDDGVTYKVEVVDYTKRAADGANILEEAMADAVGGRGGTFTVTDFPRWDLGANSVYGTAMIIDKKDKDSTHMLEDLVFNKGKLYLISASVPANSPSRYSLGLGRFLDTSQFYLKGYGFDYTTGHDYPLDDDNPNDRAGGGPASGYKPPPGLVSGPLQDGLPQ
jgi:hypothetical protein